MALENIHRVDGRVPEIPQTEGRVTRGGHHEPLGGVCATVREFLVMPYNTTKTNTSVRSPTCRYSYSEALLKTPESKLSLYVLHC